MNVRAVSAAVLVILMSTGSALSQSGEHWSVSGGETAPSADALASEGTASSFSVPAVLNLPRGAVLAVRTDGQLASSVTATGDNFSATLARPLVVDGVVVAETGAAVTGQVLGLGTALRTGTGTRWRLQLTGLTLIDGQQVTLRSHLVSRAVVSAANADAATLTPDDLLTFRLDSPMRIDTTRTNQAFRLVQPGEAEGNVQQPARATNLEPPLPPVIPLTPSTGNTPSPALNQTAPVVPTYGTSYPSPYASGTPYDASTYSYYGAPYTSSFGYGYPGFGYYGPGYSGYYGSPFGYGFGIGFSYGHYPYRNYPYGGYYPYRYGYPPYRYGAPFRYGGSYGAYPRPQPLFRPNTSSGAAFRSGPGSTIRSGRSFSRSGGYRR